MAVFQKPSLTWLTPTGQLTGNIQADVLSLRLVGIRALQRHYRFLESKVLPLVENPYAAPALTDRMDYSSDTGSDELASRSTRCVASLIDGFLFVGILLPTQYLTGFMDSELSGEASLLDEFLMVWLGTGLTLVLNGYLLAARGQTIGKLITKIQIVDSRGGHLLPFLRVYVYRYLWMLPLELANIFIPGDMDDFLVGFLGLMEVMMIFGRERRCLHDYIAGSKVVHFRPSRSLTE